MGQIRVLQLLRKTGDSAGLAKQSGLGPASAGVAEVRWRNGC